MRIKEREEIKKAHKETLVGKNNQLKSTQWQENRMPGSRRYS